MWAYILVVALGCLLLGALICVAAFFCWYMLRMIKELKASVDLQVRATQELLGEGSFTRISKSLSALSGSVPDILEGIREFAKVMRLVFKAAQEPEEESGAPGVRVPLGRRPPSADQESGFYPGVSDATAAVNEVTQEAERQRLIIPPEDLSRMVTDNES